MTGDYSVRLDPAKVAGLARLPGAGELAERAGQRVAQAAAGLAPRATGELAASIGTWPGEDLTGAYTDVSWDRDHFYGWFHERPTAHDPTPDPFLLPGLEQTRT